MLLWFVTTSLPGADRDAAANKERALVEWLARVVSSDVRQLDKRLMELTSELGTLPAPAGTNTSSRLGWHTPRLPSAGAAVWAEVDLGDEFALDMIALVAASAEADGTSGAGYGFPLRFRVETATAQRPGQRSLVGDFTSADLPNPGASPVVISTNQRRARYVRVTATQAWPRREDWIVALGEIFVLCGKRNVAAGQRVSASVSATADPFWNVANLTDGQSVLGPPVGPSASPTNGYLALQEPDPNTTKWVQVDLGREHDLDEIRLLPARPTDFVDIPGHGFPVRFRVELSSDPRMLHPQLLLDSGDKVVVNPGENPFSVRATGHRGRYVRVTALQLHSRGTSSSFALGELQAWAADRNVALHASVSALDQFETPDYPRWQRSFLVDGFNSRHPLLDYPEWFAGLDRRQKVAATIAEMETARASTTERLLATTLKTSASLIATLALVVGVFLWRTRTARHREVEELRRRIAADLHDEIGSCLGSIRLFSEAATHQCSDGSTRQELRQISRIASDTNEALREIVWLLDARPITQAQLVTRMRETLPAFTAGLEQTFVGPEIPSEERCPLEFARNVWLIYKEALHNSVRHSGCRKVDVTVSRSRGAFSLEIADDGQGFRESEIEPGRGLHNLRHRATQIGGRLGIRSEPGHGTTIRLDIP